MGFLYLGLFSEECGMTERLGHRIADWEDQIKKGVEDVMVCNQKQLHQSAGLSLHLHQESKIFESSAGRKIPGAPSYKRKNSVDFKACGQVFA